MRSATDHANKDDAHHRDRGPNDDEVGLGHGTLLASISAFRDCVREVFVGQ
jgi:hypothetical protein